MRGVCWRERKEVGLKNEKKKDLGDVLLVEPDILATHQGMYSYSDTFPSDKPDFLPNRK